MLAWRLLQWDSCEASGANEMIKRLPLAAQSGRHRRILRPPLLRVGASGSGGRAARGVGVELGASLASAVLNGLSRGESG